MKGKDLTGKTFKNLKNVVLSDVQEMFGVKPKPGNLSKPDVKNAQFFINKNADLLLCASVGEGFGLPVTEGLRYGKHVLARDIPVFREVGGEGVSYAAWHGAEALASAILMAIEQKSRATTLHYSSPITWQTSAEEALKIIKECNKNFAANIVQREAAYNVS